MPLLPFLDGKTVAVMGLGKSGASTARALYESGATVWCWDDKMETRAAAEAQGLQVVDLAEADLSHADLMLWSPGIPHSHPHPHPVALRAQAFHLPLICDVELLARACPAARFVGITGTNGKSTTTTLLAHILRENGFPVAVGGNLGIPALDLPALGGDGVYVLELSSYQLELLDQASFDLAVLLNITPDHLGRHGGMAGYIAAKASLFRRLRPDGVAVIGTDDPTCRRIFQTLRDSIGRRAVPVAVRERAPADGVGATGGILIDDSAGQALPVIDLHDLSTLPGRHNWQNACAAFAAARALKVDAAAIRQSLRSYPGLAHRQELVGIVDGVRYVNDSKATNADAAEKALLCYEDIYWILGGQPKEGGIAPLAPLFPRIRRAFLIGEATEAFAATLQGLVPFERCGTLDRAVAEARTAALAEGCPRPVVLLSPACASWDQFTSFEHRGDSFHQLVRALPHHPATGEARP